MCGDDGCGGRCGDCAADERCVSGACAPPPARCGDDRCDGDETCSTCPADCGQCCGDGICDDAAENCATCPADCECAEGERCDALTRICAACEPQCAGRDCGPDGCGGTCGDCAADVACGVDGLCAECVPRCEGRTCGPDGCEGDCGICPGEERCTGAGICAPPPAACGDGICGAGEDCGNCPADCGLCCGDGICAVAAGENCATCPADCACEAGAVCNPERRACVAACQPQCAGRDCGPDGCGGECGICDAAQACEIGVCRDLCVPACAGRVCGGDGCGGRCGECEAGAVCDDGRCVAECVPACAGRDCGDDGCGGRCGDCRNGQLCGPDGRCADVCVPACAGRICGDDGCGGTCGLCPEGTLCDLDGQCEDPAALCACVGDEICLDGFCRTPQQLCSAQNPTGLCPSGQGCLAGVCLNRGNGCSVRNPTGICPLGELCRDGACAPFDGAALCDDENDCTADTFDLRANRCVHRPLNAGCSDGDGCTANRCEAGVCLAEPIAGCITPPVIDPFVSPTNQGAFTLAGTKPAGAAVQIDGQLAVAESPEGRWGVNLNLVPGENVFRVRSVDQGVQSAEIEVRVIYDITAPTVSASPAGGIFLNPVSVTVAASEAATVYYTDDGGTPDRWSRSFRSAKQFRIFHDTRLRLRARDDAGNWQAEITEFDFEITAEGSRWTAGGALPEARSLATAQRLGAQVHVIGGTDGQAAQAGVAIYDLDTGEWSDGPALQVARAQLASAVVGGRLYLVGGENDGLPLNLLERLREGGGGWERLAPMPSTRFGLTAVAAGDHLFALGGKTNAGAVLAVVERYTPATDTWSNQVAQLPRPRFGHAALEHAGRIYVVGGEDEEGNPLAEVDVYSVAEDTWSVAAPLPTPRSRLTLTLNQNVGAVAGPEIGLVAAGGLTAGGVPSAVVEELILGTGQWRERTPLDAPRHSAAAVSGPRPAAVDTEAWRGWIIGGQRANEITRDLSYFTREQDYLRALPELPEGRFMAAAQEIGGRFYIFGGRAFRETTTVWAYDPETGRTVERAPMPQLQNGLGSAVLDGRIYAVGGANSFGVAVPWLFVYDPVEDRWEPRRSMPTARRDAAVATLDGRLWVIGGDNNGPLQTVEIYDPATDTWQAGPLLPAGRAGARAVNHDGALVVVFGRQPGGPVRTALRFADGQWRPFLEGCRECGAFEDAQVVLTHDHQLNVFGGRLGDQISNRVYSVNLDTREDTPRIRERSNLLRGVNFAAILAHYGRIYLLGGNDSPGEPGPEGQRQIQAIRSQCFNGLQDGAEVRVDHLGGCPEVFPPECRDAVVLSSAGRRVADPTGNLCDRNLQVNTWYRLEGAGGERFTTTNPRVGNRCGTDATGYLTAPHPGPDEGVVDRNACYFFLGNNCWTSASLRVRNCGDYFVYSFTRTSQSCSAALCTE